MHRKTFVIKSGTGEYFKGFFPTGTGATQHMWTPDIAQALTIATHPFASELTAILRKHALTHSEIHYITVDLDREGRPTLHESWKRIEAPGAITLIPDLLNRDAVIALLKARGACAEVDSKLGNLPPKDNLATMWARWNSKDDMIQFLDRIYGMDTMIRFWAAKGKGKATHLTANEIRELIPNPLILE